MKGLILALMMFGVIGAAKAETVTLEKTGCSYAYWCGNVTNDSGENVFLTYSAHYGRLIIDVGDVQWDSGLWAAQNQTTIVSLPMYDGLGHIAYASVTFTGNVTIYPCHQSGRVCVFGHTPTYVSGSLVQ